MVNEKVLIDSSVWIEYFRAGEGKIFNIVDFLLDRGSELLDVKKYKGSSVYYIDTKKSDLELKQISVMIPFLGFMIDTFCR